MPTAIVPAAFEHVEKALEIGIGIVVRMVNRVAHARLRREMHDTAETCDALNSAAMVSRVGQIDLDEA